MKRSRGEECKVRWEKVTSPGIHDLPKFRARCSYGGSGSASCSCIDLGSALARPVTVLIGLCLWPPPACLSAMGNGLVLVLLVAWGQTAMSGISNGLRHVHQENRTVREALQNDRWILDLRHGNYRGIVRQVIQLAREIRQAGIAMEQGSPDSVKWTLCSSGQYSARTAYMAQFANCQPSNYRELIWKVWAPGKIKMFL